MPLRARFAREIGTKASLRVYWGDDCPSCNGFGQRGFHNAIVEIARSEKLRHWRFAGTMDRYLGDPRWPSVCDHCGAPTAPDAVLQVFYEKLYDIPEKRLQPGDLFYDDTAHLPRGSCIYWDNCAVPHLMAILPNGRYWDIDSRASNCTRKDDRLHRCWIRSGEPPLITVGKAGDTCAAGAGSIVAGDYHGFLRHGEFT